MVHKFVFVTDTLAAAPLGLQVPPRMSSLRTIRGVVDDSRAQDRQARRCDYVFQYTSELWETVYLDEVSVVGRRSPGDIDVFTDQRFRPPPYSQPAPVLTRRRVYPHGREDSAGQEVTQQLLQFDHRYPEQLVPTRYQGIVDPTS